MTADFRLQAGFVDGIAALATSCARRAQTELHSAADGVPDLAFAPTCSTEMRSIAADLRARAAQASDAAHKLSSAAASFESLAEVVNASVLLPAVAGRRETPPAKRSSRRS